MEKQLERVSFPSFWISPDVDFFDTPINKMLNKNKHKRCMSGKSSPYQDQSSLLKLRSALNTITRKQSPNATAKIKKSPYLQKNACVSNKYNFVVTKPKPKKVLKKTKKKIGKGHVEKLKMLNKKECKLAPKIYENQIFCDIYDEQGNHDRVMETFDISANMTKNEEDSIVFNAKFIVASNLEAEQEETEHKSSIKPPDNSFLASTERKIKSHHFELFKKLENLANERSLDEEV